MNNEKFSKVVIFLSVVLIVELSYFCFITFNNKNNKIDNKYSLYDSDISDEINVEDVNYSDIVLNVGDTVSLYDLVVNSNNLEISSFSINNKIASIDNLFNVMALEEGSFIITIKYNDGSYEKVGVNISEYTSNASVNKMINVSNSDVRTYYKDIKLKGINAQGKVYNQMMQNFDIDTKNHYLYFTYSYSIRPDIDKFNSLKYVIARIKLNNDNSLPSNYSNSISYMYLNNSGHGEGFDVTNGGNYMWVDANGVIDMINGRPFSHHYSAAKIKFVSNYTYTLGDGKGSILDTKQIKNLNNDNSNKILNKVVSFDYSNNSKTRNPEISLDESNGMVAVRNNSNVSVYKLDSNYNFNLSDKTLYSFNIPTSKISSSDKVVNPLQGVSLYNNYLYAYYGASHGYGYIFVYDMNGKDMRNYGGYRKIFYVGMPENREAEGIKVVDGFIYVGCKYAGKNGYYNKIYKVIPR